MTFALSPNSPDVDGGPRLPIYLAPDPRPETRVREPLAAHLADVVAVERYAALPAEHVALRARWAAFIAAESPCRARLVDAVVRGDDAIDVLRAAALAEISGRGEAEAELRGVVAAAVHGELERLYKPAAAAVYKQIGSLFNDAAKGADDQRLDELTPALLAAARLAGASQDVSADATSRLAVTLMVDPKRAHRRRVARAWPGWEAIRELGAGIRAHPDPRAELWQLPRLVTCVDGHRRLTQHDPLDGPLPRGWQLALDGWVEERPTDLGLEVG